MPRLALLPVTLVLLAGIPTPTRAGPIVHDTDFIPDASRTGFNGFESIPNDGTVFTGGLGPYAEGGIRVNQVNGNQGNGISVISFHPEGAFGWFPDAGDTGYTRITLANGGDFDSVGFLVGTGSAGSTVVYELRENGVAVLTGTLPGIPGDFGGALYLGFSGGGFNEILLRDDSQADQLAVTAGGFNTLALDAIEITGGAAGTEMPEPAGVATFGLIGAALGVYYGWRRNQAARM